MYAHLEEQKIKRVTGLEKIGTPTEEDKVRAKVIGTGGKDMSRMYENNVGKVWDKALKV
jgi:salicylate hydroxylase